MVMLKVAVFVTGTTSESVTSTVNVEVPATTGIPDIVPVELFCVVRVSPDGSCP
jgi:hypothetical protein